MPHPGPRRDGRPAHGPHGDPTGPARTDEELLAGHRAGDGGALAELVGRHWRPVRSFLRRMLGETSAGGGRGGAGGGSSAEDLTQETFLRAVGRESTFRLEPGRRLRPWLYAIALNLVRAEWRSRAVRSGRESAGQGTDEFAEAAGRPATWSLDAGEGGDGAGGRTGESLLAPEDPGPLPDEQAGEAEMRDLVRRAVESLPAPQREAVILGHYQGLSHAEIAEATGKPVGTVKSLLFYGLRSLQAKLAGVRRRLDADY